MARCYIRKRGDKRCQIVYDAPRGADGQRRQRHETITGTKRHAQARLTEILLRSYRELREAQLTERDLMLTVDGQLCLRPDGKLMRSSALTKGYKRIAIRCGLMDMRRHDDAPLACSA